MWINQQTNQYSETEVTAANWSRVSIEQFNELRASGFNPTRYADEDESEGQALVVMWAKFQDATITNAEQRRVLKWLFKLEMKKRGLL